MAFSKRFKTLSSKLSSIRSFENPIVDYEQYSTSPDDAGIFYINSYF